MTVYPHPIRLARLCAVLLLGSCAVPGATRSAGGGGAPAAEQSAALRQEVAGAGVAGVFALQRVGDRRVTVSDSLRARRPYLPASTFKVPNSLIALELGVVADDAERFPMTWPATEIEAWNREHTFASALRLSVVPVYQIVARRVGEGAYREWLARLEYGNMDPGGGLEHFWLDGQLRTSALDQIRFLERLARRALPLSTRSQEIVRRMMVQEETACYTLLAKTGLVGVATRRELPVEERVGWYVGWVETDTASWAFALNLDVRRPEDAALRAPLARRLLARSGVLPPQGCGG